MSIYKYISPIEQPSGSFRLIDWIEKNFYSTDYNEFKCLVAFAKVNPFFKLHNSIQHWNSCGKGSNVVIGIDHKATSYQALQYALANFDSVDILNVKYSTFHPKLYIFKGPTKATAYYGSSNFTSGGLETNFEGGIIIDYTFPSDQHDFDQIMNCYLSIASPTSPLSCVIRLTTTNLAILKASGLLLDESPRTPSPRTSTATGSSTTSPTLFGSFSVKPAKPIPKNIMDAAAKSAGIVMNPVRYSLKRRSGSTSPASTAITPTSPPIIVPIIADTLVIQINPHDNGEVFLSKNALVQNPAFFGYPFTGRTIPKKTSNPSYPQRVPDPIVNINVFDTTGTLVSSTQNYNLNMIEYTRNAEVRITIKRSLLSKLHFSKGSTNYPILAMKKSSLPGIDYELNFYEYCGIVYNSYLAVCNQTLPSGGKSVPRKMGWL